MAKYSVTGAQANVSTSFKTAMSIRAPGASPARAKLYDLTIGVPDAPSDNALTFQISRTTANGTDTAVTPQALDPADQAARTTAGQNNTVEPTVTANSQLLTFGFNQRATYRWVAAPGGELIIPATINNGLALRFLSPAYVGSVNGSLAFEE